MNSQLRDLGIEINSFSGGNEQKTQCPQCRKIGKTNYKDKCLAINLEKSLYYCHKCGWKGTFKTNLMNTFYNKPSKNKFKKITNLAKKFLNARGISDQVIDINKIQSSVDGSMIMFPYYRNGELINYKSRGLNNKFFTQAKEAEAIIYNYDRVKGKPSIIVCEGEIDSLSWEEAGCVSHTSVNMGAPNPQDKTVDKKLQCISNCYEAFEFAKTIYIATDNDENGRILEDELIRRLGTERCKIVDFSPFKDANEVLLQEGKESLLERLKNATEPKVEGVFTVSDVYEKLIHTFRNGQEVGTTTYIPQVDDAWTWRSGEVNVWTGYQNEGKSLFLNQLTVVKAAKEGWRFGYFSPENTPMEDFFNDFIEMYIGKSTQKRHKHLQMSESEYNDAIKFIENHFFVIYPKKNYDLSTIFEKAKYLVRSKGINSLIIDPYNVIHHKMRSGEREDLYISRFMGELKRFAVENKISVHLVAHQVTPRKEESGKYPKPDLNYVKGGSEFANKADNVLFVWRPNKAINHNDNKVIFGSQKIKKQKLVGFPQDVDSIEFDIKCQRYYFNGVTPFTEIDNERNSKEQINITSPLYTEIREEKVDNNEQL